MRRTMNLACGRSGRVHANSGGAPLCGVYKMIHVFRVSDPVTCKRCRIMLIDIEERDAR